MTGIAAQQIDHVTIIVTELNRANAFYGGLLGLREVSRPQSFDFPGAWYQIGETFLHLLAKPAADSHSPRHFSLRVRDVRSAARELEAAGCPVQWEAKHKIPGIDRFFIRDPDGNRIEIQGPDMNTRAERVKVAE